MNISASRSYDNLCVQYLYVSCFGGFTEDYMYQLLNPGIFSVTLLPEQVVEGELIFMPTEVINAKGDI